MGNPYEEIYCCVLRRGLSGELYVHVWDFDGYSIWPDWTVKGMYRTYGPASLCPYKNAVRSSLCRAKLPIKVKVELP